MSRRRSSYRSRRRTPARSSGRPNLFWGRALLTAVVLMVIWAHYRGQA